MHHGCNQCKRQPITHGFFISHHDNDLFSTRASLILCVNPTESKKNIDRPNSYRATLIQLKARTKLWDVTELN